MARLRTRLKIYRLSADMTQEELAQRVGVRRETIVRLEAERYNPSLKLAHDIARLFAVPIGEIFWFE
ncbi:MAG: helix-turn-helix transcriptional regulator [Bacillota bacterium]